MIRSTGLVACVTAALLLANRGSFAADCVGFTDVTTSDSFCRSVAWMKSRGITLGCTATTYCPNDPTTRLAMAVFMNRFGAALATRTLSEGRSTGPGVPGTPGDPWIVCQAPEAAATQYPRAVTVQASFAGLSDDNSMSWNARLYFSVDGGTTWHDEGQPTRVSSNANAWSEATFAHAMDLESGSTYVFALGIVRDDALPGAGQFIDGTCHLLLNLSNRNGDPTGDPLGG